MSRSEFRWVLLATLIIVGLSCLPYIFAAVAAPPGLIFGGVLVNPADGNSYLAKIRQGYEGGWLYQLAYSPESLPGILSHSLYLLTGHIARAINLPVVWSYHILRATAGILVLLSVYRLACELTPNLQARRWAWLIAALGSGLGILSQVTGRSIVGSLPIDFYWPQSNIFYSIFTNPHFPLTTAFEILAVQWVLAPPFSRWPESVNLALIAILGLGIASLAAYLTPVIGLVIVVGLVIQLPARPKLFLRLGVFGIAIGLVLLINFWQAAYNPALTGWLAQIRSPSPSIGKIFLGFGVWSPLALAGAWHIWRDEHNNGRRIVLVLATWIVIGLTGMYMPTNLQSRLVGGIFAPIAILAGVGLQWLMSLLRCTKKLLLFLMILIAGFNTNLLIMAVAFTAPRQALDTMYLTSDEMAVLQWLDSRVTANDVVLADDRLGNFVPAWTGARVVYGHNLETIQAGEKLVEVIDYYEYGPNPDLLSRYNIAYIIGGQLPTGWQVVYQTPTLSVYGR